jgi:type IV pilus assembly protein PilE
MSFSNPGARSGFTVIQVLMVLVGLAMVVAIAIPAYYSRARAQNRSEAIAALRRLQAAQERYFLQFNRYATSLTAIAPAGLGQSTLSRRGRYALRIEVNDVALPSAFTAYARARTGTPAAADATCQVFSLDQNGGQRAIDARGADHTSECWR